MLSSLFIEPIRLETRLGREGISSQFLFYFKATMGPGVYTPSPIFRCFFTIYLSINVDIR